MPLRMDRSDRTSITSIALSLRATRIARHSRVNSSSTLSKSAEKKFWRCVQSGEPPHLINAEPPRARIEAVRIVDMSPSNSWAGLAALFRSTRTAFLDHEPAKSELKALIPEDAKAAIGHGMRAQR